MSKNVIKNADNSFSIFFKFEDAEGDLGGDTVVGVSNDCDYFDTEDMTATSCYKKINWNLFVIDTRNRDGFKPFIVSIPRLAPVPVNEQEPLSGMINVDMFNAACKPLEKERDTVIYSIQIKDQAGNFSNKIFTEPIYIVK
ncbi:MAG: hypothetical protein IPK03_13690 [Bacteroidetes bacterium]|nr:hypothetical protein [Bacteroidota bacterium]